MARKRMVSPELLTSLKVASLPIPSRYAWVGVWMYLDDCGRGVDSAALLRAHLWPLDPSYTVRKVEADIARWAAAGLVCRYEVDGARYLHSPSWTEHQKVNHPTPSKVPPCESHEPEAWALFREDYLRTHGGLPRNVVEVRGEEGSSGDLADDCEHDRPRRSCFDCARSARTGVA